MNRRPPSCFALIFILSCFLSFFPRVEAQNAGPEWREVRPGIEHAKFTRQLGLGNSDPIVVNLLRIDPKLAEVKPVRALDAALGLETVSSLVTRHGAVAGVNAGFFSTLGTYRGDSAGVYVLDGKLLSEPVKNRAAVGFFQNGVVFGHLTFEGSVSIGKERLPLDGINRSRGKDELILFTPEFHRTTLTARDGVEVVVRGKTIRAIEKRGSTLIPSDGFIISAGGTAATKLAAIVKLGRKVGVSTKLVPVETGDERKWKSAFAVVGGVPQLIRNGSIDITTESEGTTVTFATQRNPRTAIAKLSDGRLLLATVDGRQPGYSVGVSLPELAALLKEFGAVDAINLDGGGSTTMVVENRIVNKPSDPTGERPVSDALLFFPKPK